MFTVATVQIQMQIRSPFAACGGYLLEGIELITNNPKMGQLVPHLLARKANQRADAGPFPIFKFAPFLSRIRRHQFM